MHVQNPEIIRTAHLCHSAYDSCSGAQAHAEVAMCCGRMQYVVFDEADLLLTGSFEKDVARLRQALQDSDRERKIAATCKELGIDEQQYRTLPVHIRRAGIEGEACA